MWIRKIFRIASSCGLLLLVCAWVPSFTYKIAAGLGGDRPFPIPDVGASAREGRIYFVWEQRVDLPPEDFYWAAGWDRIGAVPMLLDDAGKHLYQFWGFGVGVYQINWNTKEKTVVVPIWFLTIL